MNNKPFKISAEMCQNFYKQNSKTKQYLNTFNTFDAGLLKKCLSQSAQFLYNTQFPPYSVIFLATKPELVDFVKIAAYKCNQNYMVNKWMPGLLTNWNFKRTSFDRNRFLETGFKQATLLGLQNLNMDSRSKNLLLQEYIKMNDMWRGTLNLQEKPRLLISLHGEDHVTAIKEARRISIPTIGLTNGTISTELLEYPIHMNTTDVNSVLVCLEVFVKMLQKK